MQKVFIVFKRIAKKSLSRYSRPRILSTFFRFWVC